MDLHVEVVQTLPDVALRLAETGGVQAEPGVRPEAKHAVLAPRGAVGQVIMQVEQLPVGGLHMVGFVERLQRDLPVAGRNDLLAPLVAHPVELEGIEITLGRLQKVGQRLGILIHVDEHSSPQS